MKQRLLSAITVKRGLRAISFHAGVGFGLLLIGIYMAIVSHHWLAATALLLAAIWMGSIPLRLQRSH